MSVSKTLNFLLLARALWYFNFLKLSFSNFQKALAVVLQEKNLKSVLVTIIVRMDALDAIMSFVVQSICVRLGRVCQKMNFDFRHKSTI